jgi:hypothetical protein
LELEGYRFRKSNQFRVFLVVAQLADDISIDHFIPVASQPLTNHVLGKTLSILTNATDDRLDVREAISS